MKRRGSWKWRLMRLVLVAAAIVAFKLWRENTLEHSQDGAIRTAAERYGIDPALVKAIVWKESRFQPGVRGKAGEIGLMQIREDAANEWAEAERLPAFDHAQCVDPSTNTLAATWYFRKLLGRYQGTDNPFAYALADYNAGRGNVLRWNGGAGKTNSAAFLAQMDFPTTKDYVRAVLQRRERYRDRF